MARGDSITVVPVGKEVTTQQARGDGMGRRRSRPSPAVRDPQTVKAGRDPGAHAIRAGIG